VFDKIFCNAFSFKTACGPPWTTGEPPVTTGVHGQQLEKYCSRGSRQDKGRAACTVW
jgi:hypothetical protein